MSVLLGSRPERGGVYNRHMGQSDGIRHMYICSLTYIAVHIKSCIYKNLHIAPPGSQSEGAVVANPKAHDAQY